MSAEAGATAPTKTKFCALHLLWLSPLLLVCGWWVRDLSYQWASLVEYQFGWIVVMLAAYLIWERWPTRPPQDEPASFGLSLGMAGAVPVNLTTALAPEEADGALATGAAAAVGAAGGVAAVCEWAGVIIYPRRHKQHKADNSQPKKNYVALLLCHIFVRLSFC